MMLKLNQLSKSYVINKQALDKYFTTSQCGLCSKNAKLFVLSKNYKYYGTADVVLALCEECKFYYKIDRQLNAQEEFVLKFIEHVKF